MSTTRSRATADGKACAARNGLRGGPYDVLPDEGRDEFAALRTAVTADWGLRDAYERRWALELVVSTWRQDGLRCLELATLTAASVESPPTEATVGKLATYARYGARIDRDIGRALQALRTLRNRPDAWIDVPRGDTSEPDRREPPGPKPHERIVPLHARTRDPGTAGGRSHDRIPRAHARTRAGERTCGSLHV